MFEKDVYALVEHVAGDFDDLLMHVLVGRSGSIPKSAPLPGNAIVQAPASRACASAARHLRVALRRPEPDRDVIGGEHDRHRGFKRQADVGRGQRRLSDEYRMDELDGDVLRVGRVRPTPEGVNASPLRKRSATRAPHPRSRRRWRQRTRGRSACGCGSRSAMPRASSRSRPLAFSIFAEAGRRRAYRSLASRRNR